MFVNWVRELSNRDAVLAACLLVLVFAAFVVIELRSPLPEAGVALQGQLSQTQKASLDLIIELARLFMGWSLAVIGGAGYFLKANVEKDYPLTRSDLFLAEGVILLSVVSIFFGHLTINFVVSMLILGLLRLDDPTLVSFIRCQYLSFLLTLLTFGAYIHCTFMHRTRRSSARSIPLMLAALLLLPSAPVLAGVDLGVKVRDPAVFRGYFWLDGKDGGLLNDYINLAAGEYAIEVFGPPDGMFYSLKVTLLVVQTKVELRSTNFDSYCDNAGLSKVVMAWPAPRLGRDSQHPGAWTLTFENPVLRKRTEPCPPPERPSMAAWEKVGVLELAVSSEPTAGEVLVNGKFAAKTGQPIVVPYHKGERSISVIVRAPGMVGCKWDLSSPFQKAAAYHCKLRTPGAP